MIKIESLFYSPVKSISFIESPALNILKDKGVDRDRIFAFVQNMDPSKILSNKYTILLLSFIIIAITTYDGINKINSEEPDRENIIINMVSQ